MDGNVSIKSDESIISTQNSELKIPVFISQRPTSVKPKPKEKHSKHNITVKRSNKLLHALDLPVVLNLNPRSIYNKISQFHTFVLEHEIDLVCMSESWERELNAYHLKI